MALDAKEAHELAKGIANVSRHYDIGATQKTLDITNLVTVAIMIYGTRLFAMRARKAKPVLQTPAAPVVMPSQPSMDVSGNIVGGLPPNDFGQ